MQLRGLVLGCSVLVPLRSRLSSLLIALSVKLARERGEREVSSTSSISRTVSGPGLLYILHLHRGPLHPTRRGPPAVGGLAKLEELVTP